MRLRHVLLAALLVLGILPTTDAEVFAQEAIVSIQADGDVTYEGPQGLLTLDDGRTRPGEVLVWNVSTNDEYVVVEVRVEGAFDVDRPRQLVPRLGDHFFTMIFGDPTDVDAPERVANLTGDPSSFTYRLGIPGPYHGRLILERDVTPPSFAIGDATDLTPVAFRVRSTTTEPALANLVVGPAEGDETIPFPTPTPAYEQTFPVQGLDPNTTYEFTITFEDWAGNEATSDVHTVTTPPAPDVAEPMVTPLAPLPGATVADAEVRVKLDGNGSALDPPSLRVFVDLAPLDGPFQVVDDVLTLSLDDLEAGLHRVTVEVANAAGGKAAATWTFTLKAAEVPWPALPFLLAALALAATRRRQT